MKNTLLRILLALLALSFVVRLRAEANTTSSAALAGEIAVDAVAARIHANGDTVTRGTSRIMVSMRLGSPNTVLPDGSWVYRGYTALLTPGGETRDGALIVRFAASKVVALTLANEATVIALQYEPRDLAKVKLLAAASPRTTSSR